MKYDIFRTNKEMLNGEVPKDLTHTFYFGKYGYFCEYSASLIVEGADSWSIEGQDQYLMKELDKLLKQGVNKLNYTYGETDESSGDHYLMCKWVGFRDPLFAAALRQELIGLGNEFNHYEFITFKDSLVKVNSPSHAESLKMEYQRKKAQLRNERRSKWTKEDWDAYNRFQRRRHTVNKTETGNNLENS